jgi:hypothetical protein
VPDGGGTGGGGFGAKVGVKLGVPEGLPVGIPVGFSVGFNVGRADGGGDGSMVGMGLHRRPSTSVVGFFVTVGSYVGTLVGFIDGRNVGM